MFRLIVPFRVWTRRGVPICVVRFAGVYRNAPQDISAQTMVESFVSPLHLEIFGRGRDTVEAVPRGDDRNSLLQRLEEATEPNKIAYYDEVNRFLDRMSKFDSLKSMECMYLIKLCGSSLTDRLPSAHHKLIDKLKELFKDKKAPLDTSHYNTLLSVQCKVKYPQDPEEFLKEMEENGLEPNRVTYRRLLHRYCQLGQIEGAYKMLQKMKDLECPIDENVFNSLILGNLKAGNIENAENTFKLMQKNGIEPIRETYVCFFLGYIDYLEKEEVQQKLDELLVEMQKDNINFTYADYIEILTALILKDENSKLIDKLLERLPMRAGYLAFNQSIINILLQLKKLDVAHRILLTYLEPNYRFGNSASIFVMGMIRAGFEFDKVVEICEDFEKRKMDKFLYLKAAQVALKDCDLSIGVKYLDLFEKKTGMSRLHFTWPRLCNCKSNDELFEVLKSKVLPHALTRLHTTFKIFVWPRVKGNYLQFLLQCEKLGFETDLLAYSFSLFYKNGRLSENEIEYLIQDLIRAHPETSPSDSNRLMAELCRSNGLSLSPRILNSSLKNLIQNLPASRAVEEWFSHVKLFKVCSCKSVIMQKLIENDDTKALQEVVDCCIKYAGETSTMACLALAFLRCGKINQAKKLLSRPGFFLADSTLDRMCQKLIDTNDMETLEKLVRVTRGLSHLNRQRHYSSLLDAYIRNNAVDQALEMWTAIQDEDLVPSSQLLSKLASFLKANGRTIPFEYKDEILELEQSNRIEGLKIDFQKAIRNNNIDHAFKIKGKLAELNCELTLGEECNIIEQLIRKDSTNAAIKLAKSLMSKGRYPSPRLYRLLFQRMVSGRMVKELENMVQILPPTLKEADWFCDLFIRAHANLDRRQLEPFLNMLGQFKSLPILGMLYLLNNSPNCEELIYDKLFEIAQSQRTNLPVNIIWLHLMFNGNYERAGQIYRQTPRFSETLILKPLLDQIRKGDTQLRDRLIEQLKQDAPHLLKSIEISKKDQNKT